MLKIIKFFTLIMVVMLFASCGEQNLQLVKFDLAKSINGINDYEPAGKTTFQLGETIFIYTQVKGFTTQQDGDKIFAWPIATVKVRDAKGKLLMTQDVQKEMIELKENSDELMLPAQITLTGSEGPYRVEVVVEDAFTGERLFNEIGVTIEK